MKETSCGYNKPYGGPHGPYWHLGVILDAPRALESPQEPPGSHDLSTYYAVYVCSLNTQRSVTFEYAALVAERLRQMVSWCPHVRGGSTHIAGGKIFWTSSSPQTSFAYYAIARTGVHIKMAAQWFFDPNK